MAIRVNKLLTELNIGLATLDDILNALGYKEEYLSPNSKIPDEIAILARGLCSEDIEFLKLIDIAAEKGVYDNQSAPSPSLKIIGHIDLDAINNPKRLPNQKRRNNEHIPTPPLSYNDNPSFWISELVVLSPDNKANFINVGSFDEAEGLLLYSVLIGTNGVGKSCLMKEIVDFFIDLHACINEDGARLSSANKGRLKGIRYHIDGVDCEVIRLVKSYFAKIDGQIHALNELRLPSIVACHFGAFDKLPTQKVNGSAQTRYDVPYYKYVGAHVNGSMISSSAIAFRLLFALNEQMDDRQRHNIRSILDFIGYDHRISLSYTLIMKSPKNGEARDIIAQRVEKDREYSKLSKQERNGKITGLYGFYKAKKSSGKTRFDYDIDFDSDYTSNGTLEELQYIYKLKQYDMVNSTNVIFHKQGCDITSEDMSSGEFAILSTVLSISAAADDPHTLVLLDEPELSLHPNWQMTLIDNLDRALANKVCHLLIATHSHMLVSDLPMKRSAVTQVEKDEKGNLNATRISECTYGWSAEEVLLKVFKTATDRNKYLAEVVGTFLKNIGENSITAEEVRAQVDFLESVSGNLSDVDPMKKIISTIIEGFAKS